MNPTIKKLWVDALRSGRFKQGRDRLTRQEVGQPAEHCCLGVLCVLAAEAGIVKHVEPSTISDRIRYDGESCFLPGSVADWAEVDKEGRYPQSPDDKYISNLSAINDQGVPFTEIADIIEAKF